MHTIHIVREWVQATYVASWLVGGGVKYTQLYQKLVKTGKVATTQSQKYLKTSFHSENGHPELLFSREVKSCYFGVFVSETNNDSNFYGEGGRNDRSRSNLVAICC